MNGWLYRPRPLGFRHTYIYKKRDSLRNAPHPDAGFSEWAVKGNLRRAERRRGWRNVWWKIVALVLVGYGLRYLFVNV